jgi:hypothetical protein
MKWRHLCAAVGGAAILSALTVTDGRVAYTAAAQSETAAQDRAGRVLTVDEALATSAPQGEGDSYVPSGWRDPAAEATERFDAPALEADLQARLGSRYAGMWESGSKFVVAIVDPTPEDRQMVAGFGMVRAARYGLEQLKAWQDSATKVMSVGREWGVGIDLEGNRIRVDSNEIASRRPDLERRIPKDALDERSSFQGRVSHPDRFNWVAYFLHQEAGLAVYFPDRDERCTTGFYLTSSAYGPFGTSAGHCADTNERVLSWDWNYQGTVNNARYYCCNPVNADVAVFSTANIGNYARVQNQGGGHWGVMGQFSDTWPRTGETGCWSGAVGSNADVCGTISQWDYTWNDGSRTHVHNYCVNILDNPGDSGGPMYRLYDNGTVRAMAGISGRIDGVGTCGHHIQWILWETGMSLATTPW